MSAERVAPHTEVTGTSNKPRRRLREDVPTQVTKINGGKGSELPTANPTDSKPERRPVEAKNRSGMVKDEGAFKALVEENMPKLLRIAARKTGGDRQLAEDLVQESLLRLAQMGGVVKHPLSWLIKVLINLSVDAHRAKEARPTEVFADRDDGEPRTEEPVVNGFEEEVTEREAFIQVLRRLSPKHRRILFAVYFQDSTLKDAASQLKYPIGTIKSGTYYGLRALRNKLEEIAQLEQTEAEASLGRANSATTIAEKPKKSISR